MFAQRLRLLRLSGKFDSGDRVLLLAGGWRIGQAQGLAASMSMVLAQQPGLSVGWGRWSSWCGGIQAMGSVDDGAKIYRLRSFQA